MAEDFSVVGRADWSGILGLTLGSSLYLGNLGQGRTFGAGDPVDARTMIWEGHVEYRPPGLDARALLAVADVDELAEMNRLKGLTGSASAGCRLVGGYAQLGYDLLNRAATFHQLNPFFRYETLDTQAAVPRGFDSNSANDTTTLTPGLSYKPRPQIVGKTDYQIREDSASAGVNRLNVALGDLF